MSDYKSYLPDIKVKRPPRVKCDQCIHFVNVGLEYEHDLTSKIMSKAKCKKGKRVMFRMPTNIHLDNSGYFRYCNEFEKKSVKLE